MISFSRIGFARSRRARGWIGPALALCVLASAANAQGTLPGEGGGEVGDVPGGVGVIVGRVVHPDDSTRAAGLDLALYALQPDGAPGLREGITGPGGEFRFENVSNATGVVYLVGARYREIPFGQRLVFDEGATQADVEIAVADPVSDPSAIRVRESELRLEARGGRLVVQETHRLTNAGDRVVFVRASERADAAPAFESRVPAGAEAFTPSSGLFEDSVERRGDRTLYWGPIYPGDSEVQNQYTLAAEAEPDDDGRERVELRAALPAGAGRLVVLVPEDGVDAELTGLTGGDVVERDGRRYARFEADGWAPGRELRATIALPAASRDRALLRIPRLDTWVEIDGAAVTVSQDVQLSVDGDAQLVASDDEPLLLLPLPEGAEFLGVSPESRSLGVGAHPDGGLALAGPLPPGDSRVGLRFRIPTALDGDATQLDLQFEAPVEVVNLLVADTGVAIRDDRLHRRRPFRSGTRTYLHREAFQVEAGETISISLSPLTRSGLPGSAALGLVALAALAAVGLVFRPLGTGSGPIAPPESETARLSRERRAVYASIRDLDHDFDTGKLAKDDYDGMRATLRSQAVGLLRREQQQPDESAGSAAVEPGPTGAADAPPGAFCPSCGTGVEPAWRFCTACGGALPAAADAGREASGAAD